MKNMNYLGLVFPIVIFFAGFMVLNANLFQVGRLEFPANVSENSTIESKNVDTPENKQAASEKISHFNTETGVQKRGERQSSEKRSNPETAFPYFTLASVLVILILLLPRIQEISISNTTLVLKLLAEVKEEAAQLETNSFPEKSEVLTSVPASYRRPLIKEKIELIEKLLTKRK